MASGVGDKRKNQWKSDRQQSAKRSKGAFASASTAKGSSGVLITCDRTKERQTVRDALNIFNEAADKYFPSVVEEETVSTSTSSSVQQLLQEEVAALQSDAKARKTGRFTALDTSVKGVLLIQNLDPNNIPICALVDHIFQDVEETKEFSSRFINRIIPLEKIGYSGAEEIDDIARPMISSFITEYKKEKNIKDDEKPLFAYRVEISRRNCTRLDTKVVIDALATMVGEQGKVNLTSPEVVILVEIFQNTCGVSIVRNFHKYRKYNVRSIIDPPTKEETTEKKLV